MADELGIIAVNFKWRQLQPPRSYASVIKTIDYHFINDIEIDSLKHRQLSQF